MFCAKDTGIDSLFDTGEDDDENIFSALTEQTPDMFSIFGTQDNGDDSDEEE